MTSQQGRLSVGHQLAGRYQVARLLGAGEMGEVYDIRDITTGYAYSLKLFRPEAVQDPNAWPSYCAEASKAAGLGIEQIAKVYDFQTEPSTGLPYVLGEYVTLPTLQQVVVERGVLGPGEVSAVLQVLAPALDAAHQNGLVHRAIKPQNVFASPGDGGTWSAVIGDFGIAAARLLSPPPPGWTATPGWLAAEQADPSSPPHPTMDTYALALVVFYALTARMFFVGCQRDTPDLNQLWAEMTSPPVAASGRAQELGASLSPSFDPWFAKALAVNPAERFASVLEMAQAFAAVVQSADRSPAAYSLKETVIDPIGGLYGADGAAGQLAAQPMPAAGMPPGAPGMAVPAMVPGAAVGVGAMGAEVTDGVGEKSKKSSKEIAKIAVAAVIVVVVIVAGVWTFAGGSDSKAPDEAVASATSSASAVASVVSAPTVPEPPPEPPPPKDALVKFVCTPECEKIECGTVTVNDLKEGIRLEPGEYTCQASANGYKTAEDKFEVKAGQDLEREIKLEKIPVVKAPVKQPVSGGRPGSTSVGSGAKKPSKSCGTLLNPCK